MGPIHNFLALSGSQTHPRTSSIGSKRDIIICFNQPLSLPSGSSPDAAGIFKRNFQILSWHSPAVPPGLPWPPHRPHAPSCSLLLPTLTGAGCWHSLLLHPLPLTAMAFAASFYPSALSLNVISEGGEVTTPGAGRPMPATTWSLFRPVRLLLGVREVKPTWQRQSRLCTGS